MIEWQHFDYNRLDNIELPTVTTNKKITYYNIESAFDIETTSVTNDEVKTAFMYIWMFGIGYGEPVYFGRTWEEFQQFTDKLGMMLELSKDKRLVVYVHNLSYEFQFMRHYFEWESVFAINERKPIKTLTTSGIEFRDSYILSGYSLANTAKNLNTHSVAKLEGDLDYSKTRHHKTYLSEQELGYCRNDIEVVNAYINEQITQYEDITKIPMTNTGRVRRYVKDMCFYNGKRTKRNYSNGNRSRYVNLMKKLTLEPDEYVQLKRAFMGGFTHANANYTGQVLENVSSVDFTSSYPATMLSEKFPMSKGFKLEIKNKQDFERYLDQYCLVFDVRFHDIKAKIFQENYLSESKCSELVAPIINNGRVFQADILGTTITDVDFKIMRNCYSWGGMEIANITAFHKGYLPKPIIESVLNLYQDKTTLKGVAGKEVEYLLSKGMLNSTYGMTVTDITQVDHTYTTEWEVSTDPLETQIDEYNNSKTRFLYYAWGVWITAYSRANLWTGILNIGDDYIYSDTDSIKLLNYDNHIDYFNQYNQRVMDKLTATLNYYKLDLALLEPKTIEGVSKPIGVWDYEGMYSRFKTLGSKRYLVEEDGKLELTVAGLSKRNGLDYLITQAGGDNTKVFQAFNNDMYVPANATGKNTHTYIDEPQTLSVTDYLNKTEQVTTLSGIHLQEVEYTLSIAKKYGEFLNLLTKGYLYKGVQYI
jgi:hypothetical protein